MNPVLQAALSYAASGLSVIPIRCDGSKAPALASWKPYQEHRMEWPAIHHWFTSEVGIAIICGRVSGGLEVLDFDDGSLWMPWSIVVDEVCPGLLERIVVVRTPSGGFHAYYRCSAIEGNQKLAGRLVEVERGRVGAREIGGRWYKPEIRIETRGEGGYCLAPESPAQCHPTGRPYRLLGGSLLSIPTVAPCEREAMLTTARSFDRMPAHEPRPSGGNAPTGSGRPGDDYNARGDWYELLTRHGWTRTATFGVASKWKRPGGDRHSATLNYQGRNLLTVFSSSCPPFEPDESYTLFQAYALLEHHGDFSEAARALAAEGYGDKAERPQTVRITPPVRPQTIRIQPPARPATVKINQAEVAF